MTMIFRLTIPFSWVSTAPVEMIYIVLGSVPALQLWVLAVE